MAEYRADFTRGDVIDAIEREARATRLTMQEVIKRIDGDLADQKERIKTVEDDVKSIKTENRFLSFVAAAVGSAVGFFK